MGLVPSLRCKALRALRTKSKILLEQGLLAQAEQRLRPSEALANRRLASKATRLVLLQIEDLQAIGLASQRLAAAAVPYEREALVRKASCSAKG